MYTLSYSFTVAVLLISMFVVSISAELGPECTRTSDEVDTSTNTTVCFLPGGQPQILPSDNRRTCYRTCITEGLFVRDCCASFTNENNLRINILAPNANEQQDNYNVRIIQSPNFLRSDDYSSSTICRYNVQCRPGQILHYIVTDHTLQGPERDPPDTPEPICVDFLGIDRSAYNPSGLTTMTCGDFTAIENDSSDFNLNRTSVLFQTNRRAENNGFLIVVTCVSPSFYNLDGCTQARTGQTAAPPVAGRRKRETEVEEMFKIREKRFRFRVPCIKVPTDAAVSYENSTVRVVRGTVSLYRFPGIRVFHVFNRAERFQAFFGSAGGRVFPGFGRLQIGHGKAIFIQDGVKPQLRLTVLEQQVIRQLWNALLTQTNLLASEDFSVDDPLDLGVGPPGVRERRQTQPIDLAQLVEDNMNACNGVLRANACAIREITLNETCEVPSTSPP